MATTWKNLFDLGECTVQVIVPGEGQNEVLFSKVMTKGDSESFYYNDYDVNCNISVSQDGLVTLENADDISEGFVEINIIPSYPHNFPARVRNIEVGRYTNFGGGQLKAHEGYQGNNYRNLDKASPPAPDPLDLSEVVGDKECVGMYFRNGVID